MSAWAKVQTIEGPVSFKDITSEQLARSLQEKEFKKQGSNVTQEISEIPQEPTALLEVDQTESDEVIAYMLQTELNEEHDLMLKRTEKKFNGNSKVNISYLNYRIGVKDPEEPSPNLDDENRDFDRFVSIEKEKASIPRCGFKKVGHGNVSQIVTKHDTLMNSRLNACRVLEFPPGIKTGDTGGFDVKLNNKVFNSLRQHNYAHCSREKAKMHPKPQPKKGATKEIK